MTYTRSSKRASPLCASVATPSALKKRSARLSGWKRTHVGERRAIPIRKPVILFLWVRTFSKYATPETRQVEPDWRMRDLRNGSWADSDETEWTGPVYAVRSTAETEDRAWIDIMVESGIAA